jgi:cytochrome c oxidase subunit 4
MSQAPSNSEQSQSTHTRPYLVVFFALLVGTALTVWASYIHFNHPAINIALALLIASVKASLVASYFMHLISERKLIYSVLIFTALCFVGLMFLTIWAAGDRPVLRH